MKNKGLSISFPSNSNSSFSGIYVDVHEPLIFYESLSKDKGLLVKRVPLQAGDYAFSNIGIERKEFSDYMNSLTSGRLWKQMFKLRLAYERPILAIEGLKDPMIQLHGREHIRFVSSMARIIKMGVSVVFLPTRAHFLSFVQYLFLSCGPKEASFRPIPRKVLGRTNNEIKEDLLVMIPGIGRKTAKAILARFNTLEELVKASQEELQKRTPLGHKKAKLLWEIFHT